MTAKLPTGPLTLNDLNNTIRDVINDIKNNSNGNVVGPGTVTDGALALFDGTTGNLLKQSAATTASLPDSTDRRYVTDAEEAVIGLTSGTNTGDQPVYGTIAVATQTSVVAVTPNDTLTLIAGSNITITTAEDAITIAASSGGPTAATPGGSTITATIGEVINLDTASGTVVTLPATTGGGGKIRCQTTAIVTSNSHLINIVGSDRLFGIISAYNGTIVTAYVGSSGAIRVGLNGGTTGGSIIGEYIELIDQSVGKWFVSGFVADIGTSTTPFLTS